MPRSLYLLRWSAGANLVSPGPSEFHQSLELQFPGIACRECTPVGHPAGTPQQIAWCPRTCTLACCAKVWHVLRVAPTDTSGSGRLHAQTLRWVCCICPGAVPYTAHGNGAPFLKGSTTIHADVITHWEMSSLLLWLICLLTVIN